MKLLIRSVMLIFSVIVKFSNATSRDRGTLHSFIMFTDAI